ncbi:MAG: ATP-binding protein [Acidobacteriota bacterium]|nr:ATP-binding protein [Acidobacteriota bacterium]
MADLTWLLERYVSWSIKIGQFQEVTPLITTIISGVMAFVILLLSRKTLREEKWLLPFGLAFFLLFVHYGYRFLYPSSSPALFGPVTSLLFLAAARAILFQGNKQVSWRKKLFPWWAIIIAGLVFLADLMSFLGPYHRLPSGIFSAFCLFRLAFAMLTGFNANTTFLKTITWVGTGGTFFYCFLFLIYAFHPVIAWDWMGGFNLVEPGSTGRSFFGAGYDKEQPIVAHMDTLLFAVYIAFEINLFFGAFFLAVRSMEVFSLSDRKLLKQMTHGNVEYLGEKGEGILKALGQSTNANQTALCIRIPGRKDNQVGWWAWFSDKPRHENPLLLPMPAAEKSLAGRVFATGEGISSGNWEKDPEIRDIYQAYAEGMKSIITEPVFYQGAIIACLNLEWKKASACSATLVSRVKEMAKYIAPTIHAKRQMMSLEQLSRAFDAAKAKKTSLSTFVESMIGNIQDIMAPYATVLLMDIGFQRLILVCDERGCRKPKYLPTDGIAEMEKMRQDLCREYDNSVPIYQNLKKDGIDLGRMALIVGRKSNERDRPTMARDDQYRKAVAALAVNATIDIMEMESSSALHKLQAGFDAESSNKLDDWYAVIDRELKKLGVVWTAAYVTDSDGSVDFWGKNRVYLESLTSGQEESIYTTCLTEPLNDAYCIIRLLLNGSLACIWLGLGISDFDKEMAFDPSPWRAFLDRLRQSADLALTRITNQKLELQAERLEAEAITANLSALWLHELGNISAEINSSAGSAEDKLKLEHYDKCRDQIGNIKNLTRDFSNIVKSIPRSQDLNLKPEILTLRDVSTLVKNQYKVLLARRNISLNMEISPIHLVSIPQPIAYQAVANLIMNSAKAIHAGGMIDVRSDDDDTFVYCEVTDNGPGVPEDIADRIFEIGFSTSGGQGLGLPSCRSVLQKFQADIEYDRDYKNGARFKIKFLRAKDNEVFRTRRDTNEEVYLPG